MSAKIEFDQERLVLCATVIGIMRSLYDHYLPTGEPFGRRLEEMFIAVSIAMGQIEGKPFSIGKMAVYMNVPRTTVIRRLSTLRKWGLLHREGLHYYLNPGALNSIMGLKCYRQVRQILKKATGELSTLDTHSIAVPSD
jgi:hypothetical protein